MEMRFSRFLIAIAIAAVPLWYVYRTLEEKRVRNLEWPELFMTEPERKKAREEKEQKAKEAAEAERVAKATELEKATAARKAADAEAAKAETDLVQKKGQEAAEVARLRLETEKRAGEVGIVREKLAAERVASLAKVTTGLNVCAEKVKEVEAVRHELAKEQASYRAFIAEVSQIQGASKLSVPEDQVSATFRMLSQPYLRVESPRDDIADVQRKCEVLIRQTLKTDADPMDDWVFRYDFPGLISRDRSAIADLHKSHTDIQDLLDYVTDKLPDTVGGSVRKARAKESLDRGRWWKEK